MRDVSNTLGATTGTPSAPLAELPVLDAASDPELQAQLKQAAVKFEAFFVAQMMQQMRKATAALAGQDSPLNKEVNQAPLAMADMAVADDLANQSAFGIADVLVRQMSHSITAGQPERFTARNSS